MVNFNGSINFLSCVVSEMHSMPKKDQKNIDSKLNFILSINYRYFQIVSVLRLIFVTFLNG